MDLAFKERFLRLWERYFDGSELPLVFYYTDREGEGETVKPRLHGEACFIGELRRVRQGRSLCFEADDIACAGGKKYLGYAEEPNPDLPYFLSCGIPGEVEGMRYKKTPETARQAVRDMPSFKAPGRYLVFKRWDGMGPKDDPDVVVFFAGPDALSGLFTLAGFDEVNADTVIAPFSAGCGAVVLYPYLETGRANPRGILGMFDVSARPYAPRDTLTFSLPMKKFRPMVDHMEQSFLTTDGWAVIRARIRQKNKWPGFA